MRLGEMDDSQKQNRGYESCMLLTASFTGTLDGHMETLLGFREL